MGGCCLPYVFYGFGNIEIEWYHWERKDEVGRMKINQNISAVIVNDQLLRNENSVAESVKKLSSGLKFNHPKDNPSGMAISFKMQAQIHALNRASLNTTDGTSMVETIDGAMGEMVSILQRIRELCVQAGNDTNTEEDREAIQQEIDALKEEVNRVSTSTEFNNKTLLDGSLDRRTYVTSEVTPAGTTVSKKVSMFDQITNVIISDEVQAGDYNVTIEKAAEHAVIVADGNATLGTPPAPVTMITEDQEGIVCINGAQAKITAGMTADDVYEALRDAGEMGWVNVFATTVKSTDPKPSVTDPVDLDTQGYEKEPGGYQFGGSLAFVSENYGADEKVTITCDNDQLAEILGIAGIPGCEIIQTFEYSLEENGVAADDTAVPPTTAEPAKMETVPYTGPAGGGTAKTEFGSSGTLYINDIPIAIKEGMSADDVYKAIQNTLDKIDSIDVTLVDADGDGNYEFSDKITFTTKAVGAGAKITIKYDNDEIGELLGFSGLTPTETILSSEYKVSQAGENAEVSIKEVVKDAGGNIVYEADGTTPKLKIRDEYTGQAVAKTDGNQVIITDKSGFEMSFEVRGDVVKTEIKIEATDIGTLQLQIGANEGQELAVRVPVLNTQSLYMDDLDVRKIGGSDRGLEAMDKAIGIVTAARSLMGAYENRLDYIKSNLDESEENMTTAISRLADVDMAAEMTEYTNANVLTQASISVLAQANDLPQQVLSLLRG